MVQAKLKTREELERMNAVDLTPRIIRKTEEIEVYCGNCRKKTHISSWRVAKNSLNSIGMSWRCEECYSLHCSESRQGKQHVHKAADRSEFLLKAMHLVDTKPRNIKAAEKVEVKCVNHPEITSWQAFNNLQRRHEREGFAWRCDDCFRKGQSEAAALKTGEKNPFYGKKHNEETKERISKARKEIESKRTIEEKKETGKKLTEAFLKKYGCNPMDIAFIRNKQYEATHTPEFIEKCAKNFMRQGGTRSKEEIACRNAINMTVNNYARPAVLYTEKSYKELDMLFIEKRIAIEYNGLFTHSEEKVSNNYHLEKLRLCLKNDIRLIQIFSHEWLERPMQVMNFIQGVFGNYDFVFGARECELRVLSIEEANHFIETYHIQGRNKNSFYALGLAIKDKLMQVVTFGRHHRDGQTIVLNRFAARKGVFIQGGFARLCKHASEYFKEDIVSWVDRRWSEGNGYLKAGWIQEDILPPDYFYVRGGKVFSKQSRKKDVVNTPEGMTEHEHALSDGLLRVYDCGKIRFRYTYKF